MELPEHSLGPPTLLVLWHLLHSSLEPWAVHSVFMESPSRPPPSVMLKAQAHFSTSPPPKDLVIAPGGALSALADAHKWSLK